MFVDLLCARNIPNAAARPEDFSTRSIEGIEGKFNRSGSADFLPSPFVPFDPSRSKAILVAALPRCV
ncbi:MAG: hypothetical protein H7210_05415 [Pyrinomonadaceae bacterium]|nr:hypothetical protein [Phycisphaerales bacterium]